MQKLFNVGSPLGHCKKKTCSPTNFLGAGDARRGGERSALRVDRTDRGLALRRRAPPWCRERCRSADTTAAPGSRRGGGASPATVALELGAPSGDASAIAGRVPREDHVPRGGASARSAAAAHATSRREQRAGARAPVAGGAAPPATAPHPGSDCPPRDATTLGPSGARVQSSACARRGGDRRARLNSSSRARRGDDGARKNAREREFSLAFARRAGRVTMFHVTVPRARAPAIGGEITPDGRNERMTKTVTLAAATAGHAEGGTTLNAFDNALLAAGIGNINLIKVSSILPPDVPVVELPEDQAGRARADRLRRDDERRPRARPSRPPSATPCPTIRPRTASSWSSTATATQRRGRARHRSHARGGVPRARRDIREMRVVAVEHTVGEHRLRAGRHHAADRGGPPLAAAGQASCERPHRASSPARPRLAAARIAVYGIPFEGRVNLRKGADGGPRDLRLASDSIETYSPVLGRDLEDLPLADLGDCELPDGAPPREQLDAARAEIAALVAARASSPSCSAATTPPPCPSSRSWRRACPTSACCSSTRTPTCARSSSASATTTPRRWPA